MFTHNLCGAGVGRVLLLILLLHLEKCLVVHFRLHLQNDEGLVLVLVNTGHGMGELGKDFMS